MDIDLVAKIVACLQYEGYGYPVSEEDHPMLDVSIDFSQELNMPNPHDFENQSSFINAIKERLINFSKEVENG